MTMEKTKPGAPARDLFQGCPPSGVWRRDPRFAERQPQLWSVIRAPEDRALLCAVAMQVLDEGRSARMDLSRFMARAQEAGEPLTQRPRLRQLLAQASFDCLDEFVGRIKARQAQLAARASGA